MKVVLASSSPRRKELLKRIFDEFEIKAADVDEKAIEDSILKENANLPKKEVARLMVERLSLAKADAVYKLLEKPKDTLIIGSDTAVALSDEILGKPLDRDDAVRMLRKQSMEEEDVVTGVTLILNERYHTFSEKSIVVFNKYGDEQEAKIQRYCDTNEPYDKAGAYGIQVLTENMIEQTVGDIPNIMGFPVDRVKKELEGFLK